MYALNVIGPIKTYVNIFTVFEQLPLNFEYMFFSGALAYGAGKLKASKTSLDIPLYLHSETIVLKLIVFKYLEIS